jgi:hypothetical protein
VFLQASEGCTNIARYTEIMIGRLIRAKVCDDITSIDIVTVLKFSSNYFVQLNKKEYDVISSTRSIQLKSIELEVVDRTILDYVEQNIEMLRTSKDR